MAVEQATRDERYLIEITQREADVPLSDLGRRQAESLGRRFDALTPEERPDLLMVSPFP